MVSKDAVSFYGDQWFECELRRTIGGSEDFLISSERPGSEMAPQPGGWQSTSSDLPPAGRRYNPAVYASWSGNGSGPKFGPKRADTRTAPDIERMVLPPAPITGETEERGIRRLTVG
jgi:hypothetical protein